MRATKIALAVAALFVGGGCGIASAQDYVPNEDNEWVVTINKDNVNQPIGNVTVFTGDYPMNAQVMGMEGKDVDIGTLTFAGLATDEEYTQAAAAHPDEDGNPKEIKKTSGYFKNYSAQVHIGTVYVRNGSEEAPTVGTLEFWADGNNAPELQRGFDIDKIVVDDYSTMRISESQYNKDSGAIHDTRFHADTVYLTGEKSGLVFGGQSSLQTDHKTKDGASSQSIDTLYVGYEEDGTLSKETASAGILANEPDSTGDGQTLQIKTINIGNGTLSTGDNAASVIAGEYVNEVGGSKLNAAEGETITINLNAEKSKADLGEVEGNVVANFSEATLNSAISETETNLNIATLSNGELTVQAKNSGASAEAQFDELSDRVDVKEGIETYTMKLAANGIGDGYTAVYSLENDAIDSMQVAEENAVTHGFSQLAAVGYMQWRSAMNHMQYRLGEIRDHQGYNNGAWARVYNGKDKYGSQNVENKYYGFQAGYDHKLEGTNVLVGGAVSYTRGDSDFDLGEGDNYNYDFTLYSTWLAENGLYVDGSLKFGRLSNDITFAENQIAGGGTASYDTNAISVSAEAGWRFPLAQIAYVEPQAEIMYGHVFGEDYTFNTINVKNESVDMTVSRLGVQAGLVCPEKKGGAYIRASVLHDFQGDADVTFTQNGYSQTISEDMGDTWYELGIGANYNVTDSTYLYADFNYTDGGEVESPWRWSVGIRHAF